MLESADLAFDPSWPCLPLLQSSRPAEGPSYRFAAAIVSRENYVPAA